jgi:hypothetical protein
MGECAGGLERPWSVGPYRTSANDDEAGALAREVEEFRAALARRTPRVWVGVILTVLGTIVLPAALFTLMVPDAVEVASPQPPGRRCETHLVELAAGDPIPLTICR